MARLKKEKDDNPKGGVPQKLPSFSKTSQATDHSYYIPIKKAPSVSAKCLIFLVGRAGVEPATY